MIYGSWTFRKTLVEFASSGGTNIWSGSWTIMHDYISRFKCHSNRQHLGPYNAVYDCFVCRMTVKLRRLLTPWHGDRQTDRQTDRHAHMAEHNTFFSTTSAGRVTKCKSSSSSLSPSSPSAAAAATQYTVIALRQLLWVHYWDIIHRPTCMMYFMSITIRNFALVYNNRDKTTTTTTTTLSLWKPSRNNVKPTTKCISQHNHLYTSFCS